MYTRAQLLADGVHRQREGGIAGSGVRGQGAESIVLSGEYEDDVDNGDTILYTGHGGRDPKTGTQIADQEFKRLNKSLALNVSSGQPVRVIRKVPGGYRYGGLYSVDSAYDVVGVSGFRICRFELTKAVGEAATAKLTVPPPRPTPKWVEVVTERVVRDTQISLAVKKLHGYRCQICSLRLETRKGGYAEGAHIVPLGKPHRGPDVASNVLCLCPNHHTLLDLGGLYVTATLEVLEASGGSVGPLHTHPDHSLDVAAFAHHRHRFGF